MGFVAIYSTLSLVATAQNINVQPGAGSYSSLKAAFDAINAGTHTGTVTIDIVGNTTETATAVLNASGSGAANYTSITISPSGNAPRVISGAITAGSPLIDLNGADNVMIDGLNNGGNSLSISNTTASTTANTSTIRFILDATGNTITNTTILGSANMAVGTAGGTIYFATGTNGNDNNTVTNCDIGPAGATLPSKPIYASGTAAANANNSGITINNCNIFDYFTGSTTGGAAGIYIATGNTEWTITNNRFYQTANRAFTGSATVYGIFYSNSTTGSGLTITDNVIGFANSGGTGTTTFNGAFAGAFTGINVTASSSASLPCEINQNIISDISLTSTSGALTGIQNSTSSGSNTININDNLVQNLTLTTSSGAQYGISWGSGTNISISGNTVNNLSRNTAGTTYGIYSGSSSTNETVNNNTVSNIVNSASSSSAVTMRGIYQFTAGGLKVYTNNTVFNLSCQSTSTSNVIEALRVNYATTLNLSDNVVYGISGTGVTITGIGAAGSVAGTYNIFNNKVYDLSTTSPSTSVLVIGIHRASESSNIYNNLVGDLRATAANSADAIRGIAFTGTTGSTSQNLSFNTIYLNASSTGTNFGTSGIYHTYSTTANASELISRNNIVVNTSTASGNGVTAAFRRSSATNLNNYSATSNNNLYYAGSPSATQVIYYDGTNSDQTVAAFKSRMGIRDQASVSENAAFLSVAGANANFLHLDPAVPSQAESGGVSIPSITLDYDGTLRNGSTPDIGADEFSGTPLDLTGPVIVYTPLGNTSSTLVRTLSATITDVAGVPVSGVGLPVLYWRVNAGTYTAVQGVHISGSTYTFDYGAGTVSTDVVSYYVLAQDNLGNVSANPAPGAGGFSTSPPIASIPPTTPSSYTVLVSYSGNISVGTTEAITSLTNTGGLFNLLNAGILSGNLTVHITSDLTAETGTVALDQQLEEGVGGYTITIKPDAAHIISGSLASNALIRLNGADRIIIDGSTSGGTDRSLTIINTSGTTPTAIAVVSLGTGLGAVGNTIKNCNISTSATSTSYGISVGSAVASAGADNDQLTIQNNSVTGVSVGIYAYGTSTGKMDDLNIEGNSLTINTTTGTTLGIRVGQGLNGIITRNSVSVTTSASGAPVGISIESGFTSSVVSANNIGPVYTAGTGGYGGRGITIGTETATSSLAIYNNVISGVNGASNWTGFNNSSSMGIAIGMIGNSTTITTTAGGINLYHNSVNMYGTHSYTSATITAALYVGSGASALDIRNNILVNTLDNVTTSGSKAYAIYSAAAASAFTLIDHNDYYALTPASSTTTGFVGYLSSDRTTLANWQSATGKDGSSQSIAPVFISSTDLHMDPGANATLDNLGVAISGITTDIDGNARSATPDMGADEFSFVTCAGSNGGTATATAPQLCVTGSTAITATGYSTGAGVAYQWEVSSDAFVNDVNDLAGQTTASGATTGTITVTTYYRLRVTCSGSTGYSNIVTVSVNPNPVVNVNPLAASICPGGSGISLTASGADNYSWSPASGLSSTTLAAITANPAVSTTYTVTGTITSSGCSATATSVITVNPAVTATALATPSSVSCGGSSQLTATGISGYSLAAGSLSPVSTAGLTAGTFTTAPSGDDVLSNAVPIGFSFNFYGNTYSTMQISTNGNVQFGNPPASAAWSAQAIPNSSTPTAGGNTGVNNYIALAWRDWTTVGSNEIKYFTTGVAPNRICIIDFNDAANFVGQIVLHEGTDEIDIISTNIPSNTSVQGIENFDGTKGVAVTGRNNQSWSSTTTSSYIFTPIVATDYSWSPATGLSATNIANPVATPGSTTVYTVTATNSSTGCNGTATATVTVTPDPALFVWIGAVNTDWNTGGNWCGGVAPTASDNVSISATANQPVISGPVTINNVDIPASGQLDLSGQTFTITGAVTGAGTIKGSPASSLVLTGTGALGTLNFDQTTDGTTNVLNSLTLDRTTTGSATLGNKLVVLNYLTVTEGTLNTGGFLHLRSTSIPNTARVAPVGAAGTINGDVTVERYIPLGKRAYRQLAPGVNTTTSIFANWQNNGVATPGSGMPITGSTTGANGFDATQTGNVSVFTYTPGATSFTPIPNTNATTLSALQGYRVFINGDRNADLTIPLTTAGPGTPNISMNSATTLRATGTLVTGPVTYNTILGNNALEYSLIANPYWSPVDFDGLARTNLEPTYWVWDPSIGNRGAYVNYNITTGTSNLSSAVTKDIQAGQAIFVQTNAPSPSIVFTEANKSASANTAVFRLANQSPSKLYINLFENSLLAANGTSQDGVLAAFRDDFTMAAGTEDAEKFTNTDENIAILNGTNTMATDGRPTVTTNDTVPLRIWQLYDANNYTLRFTAMDFDGNVNGYVYDKLLGQQHPLNMTAAINVPFSFSLNDSSTYYERFIIVFNQVTPLQENAITIKASRRESVVTVDWSITKESAVREYHVERSGDGRSFTAISNLAATANNGGSVAYHYTDQSPLSGKGYYRIKAVNKDNSTVYSSVAAVGAGTGGKMEAGIYPNPVQNHSFTLQLTNIHSGTVNLVLYNAAGQQVYRRSLQAESGSSTIQVDLPATVAAGMYMLVAGMENGERISIPVKIN